MNLSDLKRMVVNGAQVFLKSLSVHNWHRSTWESKPNHSLPLYIPTFLLLLPLPATRTFSPIRYFLFTFSPIIYYASFIHSTLAPPPLIMYSSSHHPICAIISWILPYFYFVPSLFFPWRFMVKDIPKWRSNVLFKQYI